MLTRRRVSLAAAAALAGAPFGAGRRAAAAAAAPAWTDALPRAAARIEARIGGRIGVAALDVATGTLAGHRGDQRFPLCSTFKAPAAAAVLARVDAGRDDLERRIRYGADRVVPYSPVTEARAGAAGLTLGELCEAAVTLGDNTAGNLMLDAIGGPAGLTRFLRAIGDPVTRLDRVEPELNRWRPGDDHDTTTPNAMAGTLRALVLGDRLAPASRDRLAGWLVATKAGDARIRAGFPSDRRIGDKTGTGAGGIASDVAVIWPPGRDPVILAVYVCDAAVPLGDLNAAIAEVARAVRAGLPA